MSGTPSPSFLRSRIPARFVASRPLRIRIRGDTARFFVEWEVLEALVVAARSSRLSVEIECIPSDGTTVLLSLV